MAHAFSVLPFFHTYDELSTKIWYKSSTPAGQQTGSRSPMDRTLPSEGRDAGSIPAGGTSLFIARLGQAGYSVDVPVGASPVQLRISKAEGRHNKGTASGRYFCLLLVLDAVCVHALHAVFDLRVGHHAPEGDVAGADAPQYGTDFDLSLSGDGYQSPVFDFLHRYRTMCRKFSNWREEPAIFLYRPRLSDYL